METLLFVALLLVAIGVLAYHRASLTLFTAAIAAILLAGSWQGSFGVVSWVIFAVVALPLNIASIRQQYITKPLLKLQVNLQQKPLAINLKVPKNSMRKPLRLKVLEHQ